MILIGTIILGGLTSCSWLSVKMTPNEVIDAVARGDAVAQMTIIAAPDNARDRQAYYNVNAELWRQLAIWFELRKPDGN